MIDTAYILLVEDNPGDARLTRALLEDPPHVALPPLRWVRTVRAAVELLASAADCRAVLLDLGLPDAQGLEAVSAVARARGGLPIVVLTGGGDEARGLAAVAAGAQDYLVKGGFDSPRLKRAIAFATQRKRHESEIVERSLHDELTGLPRRALLLDRLHRAIEQSKRTRAPGALLFIDLDGFKLVNDTHGHGAGDAVLREIAERLGGCVRSGDTVARLGGDEFVVLMPVVSEDGNLDGLARRLLARIEAPIAVAGGAVRVSASIGAVHLGDGCDSAQALVEQADAAMYAAKAVRSARASLG